MDDAALVTTGHTVCLANDVTKKAVIVVKGDVNGDGCIDSTDYLRIKGHFLERIELTGAFLLAADCDEDGTVTSTDYLQLKSYFLGTYDLFA
jgi:endo-1,4-beta-xylanase